MQKIISERAMQARINRKLAHDGQKLAKTQPHSRHRGELGRWYIVDENTNAITAHGIDDLSKLANELGMLKAGEVLDTGNADANR